MRDMYRTIVNYNLYLLRLFHCEYLVGRGNLLLVLRGKRVADDVRSPGRPNYVLTRYPRYAR